MLRFWGKDFTASDDIQVIEAEESVGFDKDLWQSGRAYFKCGICDGTDIVRLLPIVDDKRNLVCYGYQDNEADRELRMLKELIRTEKALQFEDIFPDIQRVVICGCNELAYFFAAYLESRQIAVLVTGRYWDCMGYTQTENIVCDACTLVLCAEKVLQSTALDQMVFQSVSPEFECIDKIYEANVKAGIICDAEYEAGELWSRLKEKEILLLGTTLIAQDTYDLLCGHGIDIAGFVQECNEMSANDAGRMLLGKRVMSLLRALDLGKNVVFIDCTDKNSTFGNRYMELLDYYGYERNKRIFFINDYTDVPFSNLVHVLQGKKVVLTGDASLCKLMTEYLFSMENGKIEVRSLSLGQKALVNEDEVRCLVLPQYKNVREDADSANVSLRNKCLENIKFDNYTEYFVRHRAMVLIDRYLHIHGDKYTVPELTPKGILLGRIPPYSGNVFFRGIMDGHPEILMMPYSDLNNNLFYYCIRLAGYSPDEILPKFWEMYDAEACDKEKCFPDIGKFEDSFNRLFHLRKVFTSQELFVMFHIAYAEMSSGEQYLDVSNLVIYWEPHFVSRDDFPFLALWLEDKKINGHTVRLRRNNMMRTGSACERVAASSRYQKRYIYDIMCLEDVDSDFVSQRCPCQYWTEHKLRFEDIKVYSKDTLLEVCGWLKIAWSDSMMRTTRLGERQSYRGSADFDLQPVFKKSEDFLSEFDRLRISIACSPYQKKYGYTYENCMRFSRKELQEMFLKLFLFEEQKFFELKDADYRRMREQFMWNLWKVRKHMVIDDITPQFERFELKQTGRK